MQAQLLLTREQSNSFLYEKIKSPSTKLHFHSQFEFFLMQSGELEVWINGNYKKMKAGDISLTFSFDAHAYRTSNFCEGMLVIIPTDLCPDILQELAHKRPRSPFVSNPAIFKLIQRCCEQIQKDPFSITAKGHLYVMLGTLLEQSDLIEHNQPIETDRLSNILLYIHQQYTEDLYLGDLAKRFGYHEAYLSHQFKTMFQISFTQYLTMLRLRAATEMMRDQNISIKDIIQKSGFGSTRSFYRTFHQEFGITPREYIKQHSVLKGKRRVRSE